MSKQNKWMKLNLMRETDRLLRDRILYYLKTFDFTCNLNTTLQLENNNFNEYSIKTTIQILYRKGSFDNCKGTQEALETYVAFKIKQRGNIGENVETETE